MNVYDIIIWNDEADIRKYGAVADIKKEHMNFVITETAGLCWHCGKGTKFYDIDFMIHLHPGKCATSKGEEYFEACVLASKKKQESENGQERNER